ncbi:MAG: hypothetical protein ABJJ05_15070 [Maribacter litoralis]|uniref:hypothetical protein n=1 Tax=Maribacter litoralis TaxID=2059726 RepID=UPI0032971138
MLLTIKDFAIAMGMKYATVRQHINRKKLFKSGVMIDTTFESNKIYIMEQTNGKGLDISKIKKSSTPKKIKKKNNDPEVVLKSHSKPTPTIEDIQHHSLNIRKKIADAERAEKENDLKSLELAKKMGELMPVDMVEKILTVNIRHIIHESRNEWENIASTYCEILGGNRSHRSDMVEQLNKHMDNLVKEVKEKAGIEIQQIIKDYSEVRSRGQRK